VPTFIAIRVSQVVVIVSMLIATLGVQPALASRRDPFCPSAFDSGSVATLAGYLIGFYTEDQVKAFDRNDNDQLCWLHIVGVGWQILDDGTPR